MLSEIPSLPRCQGIILASRRQHLNRPSPPPSHLWLATLVIVDNCTRRCLGLPLFTVGAAERFVQTLKEWLVQQTRAFTQ